MQFIDASILTTVPQRPAALVRISDDPDDLRLGVRRQETDVTDKHRALGWGGELRVFMENDTSAYKRRRVVLPDGSRVLRVIRPEFDAIIKAILAGEIDGLIVYDLDRLVRQPRQLEDLIDAVEVMRIPVHSVSAGHINLLTADGRAMARVLCVMAIKASDDTSRRTARQAFTAAQDGTLKLGGPRRFGWQDDGMTLDEREAQAIRGAVDRVMSGETLWAVCHWFHEQGIKPVAPERKKNVPTGVFSRTTLNGVLRSPRIAGIRTYAGVGRGRKIKVNDWRNRAATKDGAYVMGPWEPIISVEQWEVLQGVLDVASKTTNGGNTARRYLLSGFLRCGGCGGKMTGRTATTKRAAYYQCVPRDLGGCNRVSRDMAKVDAHIEELLMRRLEEQAIAGVVPNPDLKVLEAAKQNVERLKESKAKLRQRWSEGVIDDADYFADIDALNEQIKAAESTIATRQRLAARPRLAEPRKMWANGTLAVRRAMLDRALVAVTVMPQARRGRYGWDPTEIRPSWREAP